MNPIEDRLRDAYRDAAEAIRPETIRPLGARPRRIARAGARRRVTPLLAAAAVAVIVLAAALIVPRAMTGHAAAPQQPGTVAQGYSGGRMPAGPMPRFIAEVRQTSFAPTSNATVLVVVSSTTGRVAGRLQAPRPGWYYQAVATLGGDRTFVAAAVNRHECTTALYRFRLTTRGRATGLSPLALPRVFGQIQPDGLAGSADGQTAAYDTTVCRHTRGNIVRHFGQVGVISLPSGGLKTWTYTFPAAPFDLSLSADGGLLGMISNPSNGTRLTTSGLNALWILRTGSPGGRLARYYRGAIRRPSGNAEIDAGVLSPAGQATFAIASRYNRKTWWQEQLGAYQSATGRLIRVVRVLQRGGDITYPMSIRTDVSGRYVLYDEYDFAKLIDLVTGRQTVLPGTPNGLVGAAW